MFKADNKLQGIKLIRELDIASELEIKIPEHVAFVEDELGIWAQLEFKRDYPFKIAARYHCCNQKSNALWNHR